MGRNVCTSSGAPSICSRTDSVNGSKSFALVDSLGHIVARCIGFPPDPDWSKYCENACAAMDRALTRMGAPQNDPDGRCGFFKTLYTGFSMGGGQGVRLLTSPPDSFTDILQWPMPVDMKSQKNEQAVKELCADPNIRRIAHHGSSEFSFVSRHFLSTMPIVPTKPQPPTRSPPRRPFPSSIPSFRLSRRR